MCKQAGNKIASDSDSCGSCSEQKGYDLSQDIMHQWVETTISLSTVHCPDLVVLDWVWSHRPV